MYRVGSQLATDKQITRYLLQVLIKKFLARISGHQDEGKKMRNMNMLKLGLVAVWLSNTLCIVLFPDPQLHASTKVWSCDKRAILQLC